MKYCTKCGYKLTDEARFCNACGAEVAETIKAEAVSENPYVSNAQPVYEAKPAPACTEAPKSDDELRAEEQALLDKFSLGLKHERLAWKISGIVWTVMSAFFIVFGCFFALIVGIAAASAESELFALLPAVMMYSVMGLMYLPVAIINLSMKNKLESYRAKLYTDCKDGIGHFSVGSIVFCAFFNGIALIFNIVYFIQAKNNAAVIERIKARQDEYNSKQ